MMGTLTQSLHKNSIKLWRLHACLYLLGALIVSGGAFIFSQSVPHNIHLAVTILCVLWCVFILIWHVIIYPVWRYKNWRYELNNHDISIKKGIIFHVREVVPFVRVQNVISHQGPLMRFFGLSSIHISTAGLDIQIPCLTNSEAEVLREKIAVLARISREDV